MNTLRVGILTQGLKETTRIRNRVTVLLSSVALCLLGLTTPAQAITQNFSWVGWNGYYMTGTFSFDDALIGSGEIDETDLDALTIEGFRYGNPIGSFTADTSQADFGQGVGATPFKFRFNTDTNMFVQGGAAGQGQFWNRQGTPGLGFFNNDTGQGLSLDGADLAESVLDRLIDAPTLFVGDLPPTSGFNLSWIGPNGYSMTGMFSYWDIFDDGLIEGQHLNSLMIEGFLNGVSIGTWDLTDGQGLGATPFDFRFNTNTNTFEQGGAAEQTQFWNNEGNPGLGFFDNELFQGLTLDGSVINLSQTEERTLSATPKNGADPIPEPSTILLFGTGLAVLTAWRLKTGKRN